MSHRPQSGPLPAERSFGGARLWFALGLWSAAGVGCADMSGIDRRVDRIIQRQSESMGGDDVVPPAVRSAEVDEGSREDQIRKRPGTTNPPPEDLDYRGAPAERDVLARLDAYAEVGSDAQPLGLEEVLRYAQRTAREYLNAEEEYVLAAIRLLIEKHLWGPRFFNDITASIGADAGDGDYQTALNVINTLRATQRLPYGGEVEARLVTQAANQLTQIVGDQYVSSSQLVLAANIPLLRNAGLIAQEDIIQAERNVVYAARDFEDFRREFFVQIATDYFSLLAQQAAIRNQEERLKSVLLFLEQSRALVDAGREPAFQARNVEQNVLTSRNSLINSRESYILALDRFKVRLGLPVQTPTVLEAMSLELDDPEISIAEASELALRYRLDFQNQKDQVDDSRRAVANARNQLLPDLNATASAALNTDPNSRDAGVSFDGDQTDYAASITLGVPLDREIERLQLRTSIIQLQQRIREYEQFRDNLILEARQSVREIDRARFSLSLQEQAVQINELRLEELRIKADEVDTQTRLDAENELLQSRNDRDQAIRDLRIAILQYLLSTGQLRVGSEGEFRPLRGMLVRTVEGEAYPGMGAGTQEPTAEPGGTPQPPAQEPQPAAQPDVVPQDLPKTDPGQNPDPPPAPVPDQPR